MKPLLLAITTLALTLNALGLELVKCGSVKIPEGMQTNSLQRRYTVKRSKPDGTTLFSFPTAKPEVSIVVKPFTVALIVNNYPNHTKSYETNDYSETIDQGVQKTTYKVSTIASTKTSRVDMIFSTVSARGYLDLITQTTTKVVHEFSIIGQETETNQISSETLVQGDYLVKFGLNGIAFEQLRISDTHGGSMPFLNWGVQEGLSLNYSGKILIPKLNGDSIDFYLVTDPDLFPDTALGAPRVEGGSATFNVTTGSEEPVEIQASDDLKIWKRLKTLEDANGRSVTVPADAAQGFLRAVER